MPYDPRLVSEGGNRGIDNQFSRNAPPGKFRVIAVDTFDGTDWVSGDFDTLPIAENHVETESKGKNMFRMHIYNDKGVHVGEGGKF